jgi:hypothetical protein
MTTLKSQLKKEFLIPRMDYAYYWPHNLVIRQVDKHWIISLKERPFNVVHGNTELCCAYETKEQAVEAAQHITKLRNVKYV